MKKMMIIAVIMSAMFMSAQVSAQDFKRGENKERTVKIDRKERKGKEKKGDVYKERKGGKKGNKNKDGKRFNGAAHNNAHKHAHMHHHHIVKHKKHHASCHRPVVVHHNHCNGAVEAATIVVGIAALAAILSD